MKLRPYQINSINELYDYIRSEPGKNPCLVLPTGAGKSIIVAKVAEAFCKKSDGNLLMLTHVKELIQQNYDKVVRFVCPDDVGIFNAGLGKKQLDRKITFGSIQSIVNTETPEYKVIIVDEAHRINTKMAGGYRTFLNKHPDAIIIGLTATPFRLQGGFLNKGEEALFDDLIYPAGTAVNSLIDNGYLSKLKSKGSEIEFNFDNVAKNYATGDYNEKEVAKVMAMGGKLLKAVKDVVARTANHRHVLVFCAGVENTELISRNLNELGQSANYVHGKLPKEVRDYNIEAFKQGKIKYLCNANILTTGFDFPNIDCVVMLRPTQSTSLYVQIAGRGMRIKDHTDHCILLDYVGNVERHGPLSNLNIQQPVEGKKKGSEKKPAMTRCPACMELVFNNPDECPDCGHVFDKPKPFSKTDYKKVSNADIMAGSKNMEYKVQAWKWKAYKRKKDGRKGLFCELKCNAFGTKKVTIFFTTQSPFAMKQSIKKLNIFLKNDHESEWLGNNLAIGQFKQIEEYMSLKQKPTRVIIEDAKAQFPNVTQCFWD